MSYCCNCFCKCSGNSIPCPHCGYDPATDQGKYPFALRHGSILAGRYITGRVLGQGGFGITYLALDNQTKARVAIKEFMPDSMAVRTTSTPQITVYSGQRQENFQYGMECFLDEAKTLAKFQGNPGIVGVQSYFEENGTAYFVMEYVEGISFKSYIHDQGGKIPWEEAVRILLPVMEALDVVHKEGIIHRDVTPDNIFLTRDGGVRLLDFGSARYSLGDKSRSLDVVLKAGYAPKEQYTRRGRQGPYTDVYSLAACFYSAITGYLPPESLDRADEDDLVLPSTRGIPIPQEVEDVILHGLEVQPSDRYQTMGEFRDALLAGMKEKPEEEPTPILPSPVSDTKREVNEENSSTGEEVQTASKPLETRQPPSDQRERKPLSKAMKAGIATGCCILLLVCLVVGGSFLKKDVDDASQGQATDLSDMTSGLSEAEIFENSHPSEAMIVVVPRDSEIEGLEDLFGKLIAISDESAHYEGAYTGSIPDAVSLYGENLVICDEYGVSSYDVLLVGMTDAAIMNCGTARGMCFDADGSLVPEVRILDTEWTLESASVGKPAELEATSDTEAKPEPNPEPNPEQVPASTAQTKQPASEQDRSQNHVTNQEYSISIRYLTKTSMEPYSQEKEDGNITVDLYGLPASQGRLQLRTARISDLKLQIQQVEQDILLSQIEQETVQQELDNLNESVSKTQELRGTYTGAWSDGKPNGHGTFAVSTESVYKGVWEGTWKNGTMTYGVCQYSNGNRYEGNLSNGSPSGHGVMVYQNGDRYEGNWEGGMKHGDGAIKYADGEALTTSWYHDSDTSAIASCEERIKRAERLQRQLELKKNQLVTELQALESEAEQGDKIISNNIEGSFKYFE